MSVPKQVHGVAAARKIAIVGDDTQAVHVIDGEGEVLLRLGASSYPAGLTPEQAIMIADHLKSSASRVIFKGGK